MVNINIKKRHVYFLSFLIIVAGGILFVRGQGSSNFGHSADDVDLVVNGASKTLQNAVDTGDFITSTTDVPVNCVNVRSAVANTDYVQYCPFNYPNVVHCSVVDDSAPSLSSLIPTTIGCLSSGLCSAENIRDNLGSDDSYLEIVRPFNDPTQGCWQYDRLHSKNPYRIEMVCCK